MKTKPLVCRGWEVRAILEGRKTHKRIAVKPQPFIDAKWGLTWEPLGHAQNKPSYVERNANWNPISNAMMDFGCPCGQPRDHLWVRETFRIWESSEFDPEIINGKLNRPKSEDRAWSWKNRVEYRASCSCDDGPWRPSTQMPRWASRITLEIESVRVERLQEISEGDAESEGVSRFCPFSSCNGSGYFGGEDNNCRCADMTPVQVCQSLWNSINGPGSWEANPWVWVLVFRRV